MSIGTTSFLLQHAQSDQDDMEEKVEKKKKNHYQSPSFPIRELKEDRIQG
jgi:hypothetical protein